MPIALEDWTKRSDSRPPDGRWTGHIEYQVIASFPGEYVNEAVAAAACPQQGSQHPIYGPYMIAVKPEVRNEGLGIWRVAIDYLIVPSITGSPDGNPINAPIRIRWERGEETVPIDADTAGNPITNSAGDPFEPAPTAPRGTIFFTLTRNEATYNFTQADTFSLCANSSPWTIFGVNFDVNTIFCQSIVPAEEYADNATYLPVSYRFEIKKVGFQLRLLDQGKRAYYLSSGVAAVAVIWDKFGNPTTADVLLDGKGNLAASQIALGYTVSGTASSGGSSTPTGAIIDVITPYKAGTAWLKYGATTQFADFNQLGFT